MKVVKIYKNYNEEYKEYYYTLYTDTGDKVFLPFSKVAFADKMFIKQVFAKDKKNDKKEE